MKIEKMEVKLIFKESILGSLPADPAVYTKYVANKAPAPWVGDKEVASAEERAEKEPEMDKSMTVFAQDDGGFFFYDYHIKGFLKESGNVLKKQINITNLRSKVDNYLFVSPRQIYLLRPDGSRITEEDDILERPLRCQTALGPRIALAASERIRPPVEVFFTVELLDHKEVTMDSIRKLMEYGRFKGLGQWRNGGWGKFEWEEIGSSTVAE